MNSRRKLTALRALMKKNRVDAYYVPSVDPHQSEYLPECWKRRHWLSGFTGSAGDLVVTARKAALWTDSRYFLQAGMQLAGSGIELMKLGLPDTPDLLEWTGKQLKKGMALGVDPRVCSVSQAKSLEGELAACGVKVRYLDRNLVDELWDDQPDAELAPLELHSARYAGETTAKKLGRVRAEMKSCGARVHVLAALDTIAWLFNIRSRDINYTPVAISYAVVTEGTATLFIDKRKVSAAVAKKLKPLIRVEAYDALPKTLRKLGKAGASVLIDPGTTNRWVADLLKGADLIRGASPVVAMKAIKNARQIQGFADAHVRDGVAMVKFLKWLEKAVPAGGVSEVSAAERLTAFRAEHKMYRDDSFSTISGYADHGAIVHYEADEESDVPLKPRGVYLVDSGGQYPDGTTDITRTVSLGKPTKRQREMFTRVLKGNINVSGTPFPAGTTGQRLEMFARLALWQGGENYGHGTGHGVGQYLGVHEGPCSLKDVPTVPLVPGHLLSIEPGHYEAGKFGIRIENLAVVVRDEKLSREDQEWLRWHELTLCPIDLTLVEVKMLTPDERAWLNAYHKRVRRELSPHLDTAHRSWLKKATRAC